MEFERSAGLLLHPTSLPSKYGIGDFGKDAYRFVDFLEEASQTLWQIFPLGPTGYGDSPYQCFSAFAGNPLLISPDILVEEGLLSESDLKEYPRYNEIHIEFGEVIKSKSELLKTSFNNYWMKKESTVPDYEEFIKKNAYWLNDYALFMSVKQFHNSVTWSQWSKDIAFRQEGAIERWSEKLNDEILYHKFVQYQFDKQWKKVKEYANNKGIKIIGDLPIYIAYDSADLWGNKELFSIGEEGKLETVAGVPPDYFSPTGQLWGNPLYKWKKMEENNFDWWKKRISKTLELIDIIRIDHFRGFDAYWEIPGDAPTAVTGRWVKAPGEKLFNAIKDSLGDLPILAEDLGVITADVEKLRDTFNFPGMKILQFAFGSAGDKKFLPHNHIENCVVYTGSHDNDTTRGFFEEAKNSDSDIYEWAQNYLGYYGNDMRGALIRAAYMSVANIVIIPMQDILNLGTDARMNFPSKLGGNWTWRFTWDQIYTSLSEDYDKLVEYFQRHSKYRNDEREVIETSGDDE